MKQKICKNCRSYLATSATKGLCGESDGAQSGHVKAVDTCGLFGYREITKTKIFYATMKFPDQFTMIVKAKSDIEADEIFWKEFEENWKDRLITADYTELTDVNMVLLGNKERGTVNMYSRFMKRDDND